MIGVILIGISTIFGAVSVIQIKKGLEVFKLKKPNWKNTHRLATGLGLMGIGVLIMFAALRYAEVSFLFPLTAFTYVWSTILAKIILKEKITKTRWIGIGLILLGSALLILSA